MHRYLFLLLVALLVLPGQDVFAQNRALNAYVEFKAGGLSPKDTGAGNIFGISMGRRIDERLYWGFEANYFRSSYTKSTVVAEFDSGGIQFRERQIELEFATRIISLFLKLDYELRLARKSPLYFRAGSGFGGEFIWNDENNFVEDIERRRFFNGFGWELSSGLGVRISSTSILFFDIFYNDAAGRRNNDRNENGLPIFQEIDVSGWGFKFGINIFGLGF